ncbi:MAG: F-type H+-transporting ATPase subunit b [Cellvibrionaceae bacterium]
MNINLTLIGQTLTFFVFVLFCAKFIWPQLIALMAEREKKIEDGLQMAERAEKDLQLAQKKATKQLHEAKEQSAEIIDHANKRSAQIVDEAKEKAKVEADRLVFAAKAETKQEMNRAKEVLRAQVASLVIAGAEKILEKSIDAEANDEIVSKLAAQL